MKIYNLLSFIPVTLMGLTAASCAYEEFDKNTGHEGEIPITLSGEICQTMTTRAGDSGFVAGDVMGVYVVDYNGTVPGVLQNSGNHADNIKFTLDESERKWISSYDLYWIDNHTPIDVYGYYPSASPQNVNNYNFSVRTDQNKVYDDGTMGGYESSDFLWGKVSGVAPTENAIRIPLSHKMANAHVSLIKGDGFGDDEWSETTKQILVTNTVQDAVIDLATGNVKPAGSVGAKAIIPISKNDEWRAIVVPQSISAGTQIFSITINGVPYKFAKDEEFTFVPGKMSNFTIKVDKKNGSGQYALTLVSESITAWENDPVSHDATARQYVVVDVTTPGTLESTIISSGRDLSQIKNLKITGRINSIDFAVMNFKMTNLQSLNLKDVTIAALKFNNQNPVGFLDENHNYCYFVCDEDEIPSFAFNTDLGYVGKNTLINVILPDKLKKIGDKAFCGCHNLSGSLILPEGLEFIGNSAFYECENLNGQISLPSTLKEIDSGAFTGCGFISELSLPDGLIRIGTGAFGQCSGLYGNLRLPENLEEIEGGAFGGCTNLSGSLEIPQKITEISVGCFKGCGFDGTLKLHNNIKSIGEEAFFGCKFQGELVLPEKLDVINKSVFNGNNFSGSLKIPASVTYIDEYAFYNNTRLSGKLEFSDNLLSIGRYSFAQCGNISGIIFPQNLEQISSNAFERCYGISSIVCKNEEPPHVMSGAFNGIPKDNFVLEVPEASISRYGISSGWGDFKRIVAHHELVCRPSVACALSSEHKQTLVIDAEGEWEVASKPDWCQLSKSQGTDKTQVILTIKPGVAQGQTREGDVVFRLKGKDYTHNCHVTQYGYQYAEDEYLSLQKANKGNNGGINIVILGDGYDSKDIASGAYLADMKQQMEYFFGIEPYTTYRDYFNVYTAFALSTETGVGTVNTIRYNRFDTTYTGDVGLKCDYDEVFSYVLNAPTVNNDNLDQTLVIIVPNSTDYGGVTQMWESGAAIAFCPKSNYAYPLDSRGIVQHEAGGHGFGKLGDEYIYHNTFIDDCPCFCCQHEDAMKRAKNLGWYANLELTGKTSQVGWSHLLFDQRYSDYVDIFEGGFMHSRGVFRSEQNSCMNNNIPYFSAISRESIVKRIKLYAGETYSFEDFAAKDNRNAGAVTRSMDFSNSLSHHYDNVPPQIHKGSPLKNLKKSRK